MARSEKRLAELKAELADFEAKNTELSSLQPALDEVSKAKEEYRKLSELQKYEGERQRLAGRISTLEQDIKTLESRARQSADADHAQIRIAAALAETQRLLVKADQEIQSLREQKVAREHGLQAQIKQVELQKNEIEEKRARIARCGRRGQMPDVRASPCR